MQIPGGFTRIELLVAMAIFAIMGVGMYAAFGGFQKASAITERDSKRLGELQRAFRVMGRDLQQMVPRPVRDEFGSEAPLPSLVGSTEQIELTRTGWSQPPFLTRQRSELQRVKYVLEEGGLKRFYWPVLDRAQDSSAISLMLIEDVERIRFRFFARQSSQTGAAELVEQDTWPTQEMGFNRIEQSPCGIVSRADIALPLVVEIEMTLKDLGALSRKFLVADGYEEVFTSACTPANQPQT
jgi:general secretion pathway protein J